MNIALDGSNSSLNQSEHSCAVTVGKSLAASSRFCAADMVASPDASSVLSRWMIARAGLVSSVAARCSRNASESRLTRSISSVVNP
jgi:hypothetical protein